MSSDMNIATVSPASLTFTPTNYEKEQTVTVSGVDDTTSSAQREATITHTPGGGGYGTAHTRSVKVTVNNGGTTTAEDEELKFSLDAVVVDEGRKATYSVRLTTRPDSTANVILSSSTEHISFNPSSLQFTRTNYNVAQPVTVTSFLDDKVDNDPESPPDGYTDYRDTVITHTVRGGGGYDRTTGTITVRLQDDDSAAVVLDKHELRVRDSGQQGIYRVRLKSQPLQEVTVAVESNNEAASVNPRLLMFTSANWYRKQEVTVTGVDDDVDNPGPNRQAEITHMVSGVSSVPNDGYAGDDAPDAPSVMVTIVDNDTAGLKISKTATTITENGLGTTYTVQLESDANVTVNIRSSDPGVTVIPNTWTFTSGANGTWNTPKIFAISAPDNEVVNGRRTATITHTATITNMATDYAPEEVLRVTVNDDESRSDIVLSRSSLPVSEAADRTGSYTVRLRENPDDDVVVTVRVPNGSAATVGADALSAEDSHMLTFHTCSRITGETPQCTDSDINPHNVGQTVVVVPDRNQEDDGSSRQVLVEHTASGLKGAVLRVTVTDDDDAEVLITTPRSRNGWRRRGLHRHVRGQTEVSAPRKRHCDRARHDH